MSAWVFFHSAPWANLEITQKWILTLKLYSLKELRKEHIDKREHENYLRESHDVRRAQIRETIA